MRKASSETVPEKCTRGHTHTHTLGCVLTLVVAFCCLSVRFRIFVVLPGYLTTFSPSLVNNIFTVLFSFNQLDLPAYETYDKLRSMLNKAVDECPEGFGLA